MYWMEKARDIFGAEWQEILRKPVDDSWKKSLTTPGDADDEQLDEAEQVALEVAERIGKLDHLRSSIENADATEKPEAISELDVNNESDRLSDKERANALIKIDFALNALSELIAPIMDPTLVKRGRSDTHGAQQRRAIKLAVVDLGLDPLLIPQTPKEGYYGFRSEVYEIVKDQLTQEGDRLFYSQKSYERVWEKMLKAGQIRVLK